MADSEQPERVTFGRVTFGDVVVDRPARGVSRAGEPQHLEPQAFDLLVTLIDAADRVVPNSELLELVWGDQFVSESALTTRIKQIRQAVGDDGRRQAVVRNVRGRGYQFVAELARHDAERGAAGTDDFAPPGVEVIGRDATIERARELLERARVITMVGPGGVGKTTLAKHLAARASSARRDGWIMARLAALSDPTAVDAAVRRAAGVDGSAPDGDDVAALARLDAILVIDNCEHVIAAAADLVARITAVPGPLHIIATGRERLGLPHEQVVPLDVLDRVSAVDMFMARATAALPSFRADDHALERIAELVDAVDRLPLAIEMAAALVHAISLDELVPMIGAEIDRLRSVDRTADDRHRTMGALVDWSERLLDDAARRVLTELSVFRGAVTRYDIVGVIDGDPIETMHAVADLVGRSLLVADTATSPGGYRMLAVVRARIGRQRAADADRRHAQWFLQLAEDADTQLRTAAEVDAHRRLDGAADELRAAHAWLSDNDPDDAARLTRALDRYAYTRHWTEPAAWAAELLPRLDPASTAVAGVRAALAGEAAHRGEFERVDELVASVLASPDPRARLSALETAADAAAYRGDFEHARQAAIELERLGDELGEVRAVAMGELDRVLYDVYAGEPDAARSAAALDDTRPGLAPSESGWIAYVRGEAMADSDPDAAVRHYEAALELADSAGNRFLRGVSSVSVLALRARTGDPAAALQAFAPIIDEYRRAGDETHLVTALRNLVVLLVRLGDDRAATELLSSLECHAVARPSFGAEADRLAVARDAIAARSDQTERRVWNEAGARRDLAEAVEAALAHMVERHEWSAGTPVLGGGAAGRGDAARRVRDR